MRQQLNVEELPPGMRFLASESVDWLKPPWAANITDVGLMYVIKAGTYTHVHTDNT